MVAHNQEASDNLLRYVKDLGEWLCAAPDAPVQVVYPQRADRVRFTNSSVVKAMPGGNPHAIRSHGGSVWFDEYAYHRDQKENYRAAEPVIFQHEGDFRIVSTPFSDVDMFHGIFLNRDGKWDDWSRHKVTIQDAIRDGLLTRKFNPIDVEALRRGMPDDDAFNAEYMCVPLSDADSYFPRELLDLAVLRYDPHFKSGSMYGGFDVARSKRGDYAALAEVRRDGDRWQGEPTVWQARGEKFQAMQDRAVRAFEDNGWVRMAVDAGGIGNETAERIQDRLGRSCVEAVIFSSQSKAEMAYALRGLLDKGHMSLADDRELLLDLHAIKRQVIENNIKIDSVKTDERGHADRAWALALAVRAAGKFAGPGLTPIAGGERLDWGGMYGDRSGW